MSGRITDASKRRMEARNEFTGLGIGYLTLESRYTDLPVIDISITGVPGREYLAEQIIEVLEVHFKRDVNVKLVRRKTA